MSRQILQHPGLLMWKSYQWGRTQLNPMSILHPRLSHPTIFLWAWWRTLWVPLWVGHIRHGLSRRSSSGEWGQKEVMVHLLLLKEIQAFRTVRREPDVGDFSHPLWRSCTLSATGSSHTEIRHGFSHWKWKEQESFQSALSRSNCCFKATNEMTVR